MVLMVKVEGNMVKAVLGGESVLDKLELGGINYDYNQ